MTVWFLSTF